MKQLLFLPIMFVLLTACGEGEKVENGEADTREQAAHHSIDLREHDVPLAVDLDPDLAAAHEPEVRWNEQNGKLEVNAGERFRITITEEPGDIGRLKESLERDMLRTTTVIEEDPQMVIYRSTFPDEEIVFVHFYRVIEHDGRSFVIESHNEGRFNEEDVRRMARSVRPAQEV